MSLHFPMMHTSLCITARKVLAYCGLVVLAAVGAGPLVAQQPVGIHPAMDLSVVDSHHVTRYGMGAKAQGPVNFSALPEWSEAAAASAGVHAVPSHHLGTELSLSGLFAPLSSAVLPQPASAPYGSRTLVEPMVFNGYTSPSPSLTFGGVNSLDSGYIPPDSDGAVSATYVVTAVNGALLVHDRSGNRLNIKSLDSFWGISTTQTYYSYDPTIEYDKFNDRWILTCCAGANSSNGAILLAVSQTGDPSGNWYRWTTYPDAYFPHVILSTGSCDWPDFGKMGFNKNWIVVQTNMYQYKGNFVGSFISVFNKASMYAGQNAGGSVSYTLYSLDSSYNVTQTPAVSNDNSVNALYLLQNWSGSGKQLRLYKVDGSVSSPTFSLVGAPTGGSAWGDGDAFPLNFAPQAGAPNGLDAGTFRIGNAVYRDGYIWGAQAVLLNNKSVIQWWQIGTDSSVAQQGRIDETDGYFRSFPSIAVNKYDNAMIGYSRFSSGEYAGGAYTFYVQGTPGGTTEHEVLYKPGQAPYMSGQGEIDPITQAPITVYRWGDYSRTMIDPSDDLHFWTIQEYALGNYQWGTWWAHV